jgi:hypothetical protein
MSRFGRFIEATGFGNGKGHLSFNKCVTFTALWVWALFMGAVARLMIESKQFAPAALVAVVAGLGATIIGAGFGLKGYLGGAKQNSTNATAHSSMNANLTGDLADAIRAAGDVWHDDERGAYPDRDYGR